MAESKEKTNPFLGRRRGAWGGRTVAKGTLGADHASRAPESGWPLPFHEVSGLVAWVALIAPARGRASKTITNIMHTCTARLLWKPKWPWVRKKPPQPAKPPQPSTTGRAGCNARFLLREVHDSGALTGACTGKGPQMANPRPTPKQNARQLQLCSRPVSRSVKEDVGGQPRYLCARNGWPLPLHGPKPRGSHGDRRHAGVDGSLNSGFLYFSLPQVQAREANSSLSDPP